MGNKFEKVQAHHPETQTLHSDGQPRKVKACCACLETRNARDECIDDHGEEKCRYIIEAYKKCMNDLGFEIPM